MICSALQGWQLTEFEIQVSLYNNGFHYYSLLYKQQLCKLPTCLQTTVPVSPFGDSGIKINLLTRLPFGVKLSCVIVSVGIVCPQRLVVSQFIMPPLWTT